MIPGGLPRPGWWFGAGVVHVEGVHVEGFAVCYADRVVGSFACLRCCLVQARTWECEIPYDAPQEGQILDQLESWVAHQREPLVWYPADALGTNMLDPGASQMDTDWWEDVESGGARVQPGDGLPGPRFLSSASTSPEGKWAHLSNIPVPHNTTLTASVYLSAYEGQTAYFLAGRAGDRRGDGGSAQGDHAGCSSAGSRIRSRRPRRRWR